MLCGRVVELVGETADPGETALAGGLWGLFRGDACCFLLWNLSETRANMMMRLMLGSTQAVIGFEGAGNRIRANQWRGRSAVDRESTRRSASGLDRKQTLYQSEDV